ncbi:hypothetical protein JSE7799_01274 [Jannaschia seosinensis]|uniref:Uncharacterized protein n=1 Tax=Jannaschia seosinensis TaxID=313367 RepID=A0A0M7B8N1_9RHOB|nr:hypothetical protein [Jannaschia seosinensis]CUH37267.1 hypothetical protein JSE7799_01274 [Jannaschia seosinensis]
MSDLSSPAANAAQRRARARARLADAARLLPFLGAAAFLLPDLVLSGGAGAGATLPWLVYLFAVWAVLIGLALHIARRAARIDTTAGGGDGAE